MREYELYVPLYDNDGRPVDHQKIADLKQRLARQFGGLTHFPQENEGLWRMGSFTFRDRIVIFRVLAMDAAEAERFLREVKADLKREWQQKDVLIVARDVATV
ncbi:MAG: hypothetical protein U1G07_15490 [Verrucomicrobiota bacterium]